MHGIKLITLTTALAVVSVVNAEANTREQLQCTEIRWNEGRSFTVNARLHHYTHIILPEKILDKTRAIVGNPGLWDVEAAGAHIYFKPNSTEPEGASTTVSVIGESGAAYDLMAIRHDHKIERCIRLMTGTVFGGETSTALNNFVHPNVKASQQQVMFWQTKYSAREAEHKEELSNAVIEAIRKYRYHIYTRYTWTNGKGFIGKDLVSDVYDDGRFTYIRLKNDNKGLLTVEAELSGKVETVQAKYDDVSRMYRIVGIYPEFTMKYGDTTLLINRDNNITEGVF